MDQLNLVKLRKSGGKSAAGRYFTHKTGKGSLSQTSNSIEHDLSRLSVSQAERSSKPGSFCTELWSEQLLPRVEAKPFGVPNLRQVLFIQRQAIDRVELLIEVSKTDNGKFYIVVFQRYVKPKFNASKTVTGKNAKSVMAMAPPQAFTLSTFDDISVKEMWQLEAIQLLKKFDNDLSKFVNQTVSFNSRFEKVDFNALHRHLLELGALNSKQLKEGIDVLRHVS